MKAPLRLTLAQLNPTVGDIEGNTSKIFEVWEANDASTDLVIFPELFLTGYQLEDLAENWSLHADIDGAIKKICIASQKFQSAAIIPTPCILDGKLYNAFMLIETGQIKHIQKKVKLPNIGVFDEPRVFSSDDLPLPIKFRDYNGLWGPLIIGNSHTIVIEAIIKALKDGSRFGAPTLAEVEFAELIREIMPSLEMLRLVSSGTEATMSAVRLARGYTGSKYVLKFDGCNHGHE